MSLSLSDMTVVCKDHPRHSPAFPLTERSWRPAEAGRKGRRRGHHVRVSNVALRLGAEARQTQAKMVSDLVQQQRSPPSANSLKPMERANLDTETLLAILSSLLHPLDFEHTVLLDALVKSQGDVEAAAASLRSEPPRKKRKLSQKAGLQSWLKSGDKSTNSFTRGKPLSSASKSREDKPSSSRRVSSPSASGTSMTEDGENSSPSPLKPPSTAKAVTKTEFMALFRPSSDSPSKPQIPRHPPLTLVSPEQVAQHAPCTLHNSILPQELACR